MKVARPTPRHRIHIKTKLVNYQEYKDLFDAILQSDKPAYPYDDEHYINYTRLNQSRMRRWDKHGQLDKELLEQLAAISSPQHWIILTEPWCGDAAHILPFLMKMADQNALITYELQLRDSDPFLIESYLTNGTKSIPKLIVRNEAGQDLFTWGPRPKPAQEIMIKLKADNVPFDVIKEQLQQWYNQDKGRSTCLELEKLFGETLARE